MEEEQVMTIDIGDIFGPSASLELVDHDGNKINVNEDNKVLLTKEERK